MIKAFVGPVDRFASVLWKASRMGDLVGKLGTSDSVLLQIDGADPGDILRAFAQVNLPPHRCLVDFGDLGSVGESAVTAICNSLQPLGLRFSKLQIDESWVEALSASALRTLELRRCNLPFQVLRRTLDTTELQRLSLDRCVINGECDGGLFLQARHLRALSIQHTNLQGASRISELRQLPVFCELCVGGHGLTAEALGELASLRITTLCINDCDLISDELMRLQVPTLVQDLSIDARHLSDRHVLSWPSLPTLQRCVLSDTLMGGESLHKIGASGQIRDLDIGGTKVTDDDLALLPQLMPTLSRLRLDNLAGLSQPLSFVPQLAHLTGLSVASGNLTDELIRPILGHPLLALTLEENPVTEQGFSSWPAKSSLRELFLAGTAVRGEWLADSMSLTMLDLGETNTDDVGLAGLNPKNLSWLRLSGTAVGDDTGMRLSSFPVLRHLDLSETEIRDPTLAAFASSTSLEHIRVLGCKLSSSAISALRRRLPECDVDL